METSGDGGKSLCEIIEGDLHVVREIERGGMGFLYQLVTFAGFSGQIAAELLFFVTWIWGVSIAYGLEGVLGAMLTFFLPILSHAYWAIRLGWQAWPCAYSICVALIPIGASVAVLCNRIFMSAASGRN
ncbi:MAG: hypothetical protein ABSG67_13310 [Thermoguttaceae bacterium]|jgi:hypothetical protein